MVDRPVSVETTAGLGPDSERRPWSPPRMRAMKTHEAELGPNFPTTDGNEGQS